MSMFGHLSFLQNPDNSQVIADEEDISRPMRKDAVADNTSHIVDRGFEFERVGDGEPVNIEDDITVVGDHTLTPHGIAP